MRLKALVFADDSFQAFDHDMAGAPCSYSQPVSFMLGVPEKANGFPEPALFRKSA